MRVLSVLLHHGDARALFVCGGLKWMDRFQRLVASPFDINVVLVYSDSIHMAYLPTFGRRVAA